MSEERWQDNLENEDLRSNPVLDRYKTPEAAYEGLIEKEAYAGRSIGIPGEDATEDAWKEFDTKMFEKVPGMVRKPDDTKPEDVKRFNVALGMPEDLDGYTPPEDFKGLDDTVVTQLQEIAHKAGLTSGQYHNMLTQYAEAATVVETAAVDQREADEAQLRKVWGEAYDGNISITDEIVRKFGDKDIPLGDLNNAGRLLLIGIAKSLTSDPQVFNQINNPKPALTPAEIEQQIQDIRVSDVIVNPRKHPPAARKAAVAKMQRLYEKLDTLKG